MNEIANARNRLKLNMINDEKKKLNEVLRELNGNQFKTFCCLIGHYSNKYEKFIIEQNMYNLWCEINYCCHEMDESFPFNYDDFNEMISFYFYNPFYFIEVLPFNLIMNLFVKYIDSEIEIIIEVVKKLLEKDLSDACSYINEELNISENANELTIQIESFIENYTKKDLK